MVVVSISLLLFNFHFHMLFFLCNLSVTLAVIILNMKYALLCMSLAQSMQLKSVGQRQYRWLVTDCHVHKSRRVVVMRLLLSRLVLRESGR